MWSMIIYIRIKNTDIKFPVTYTRHPKLEVYLQRIQELTLALVNSDIEIITIDLHRVEVASVS